MKRLFLMIFLLPSLLIGSDAQQSGTLIVTYEIDEAYHHYNERIDRIRFWLKNERGKRALYPGKTESISPKKTNERTVVIEELDPGDYTLTFLIPNLDNHFESAPERKVSIIGGEKATIHQKIKTRKQPLSLEEQPAMKKNPFDSQLLALHHAQTDDELYPHPIAQSPAEEPDTEEQIDDQEEADISYGKLIVSFKVPDHSSLSDQVRFKLTPAQGEASIHPIQGQDMEVSLQTGKMVMIEQMPIGEYQVDFFINGQKKILASRVFTIFSTRTKSIHQPLELHSTADEEALPEEFDQAPPPLQRIESSANDHPEKPKDKITAFPGLKMDNPAANSSTPLLTTADEQADREAADTILGKIKILTNIPKAMAHITPIETSDPSYKKEIIGGEAEFCLPEGHYRVTFSQVKGHKIPEPVDINVQPQRTEQMSAFFLDN